MDAGLFSPTYSKARKRFRAACSALGCNINALTLDIRGPDDETLTIDLARLGPARSRRTVVVSSGLHGVEAPLGSAVQLAYLAQLANTCQGSDVSVVLIHALNPFGFAWRRRFNEHNVDLNRNFLLAHQNYEGAPPLAAQFQRVLGSHRKPSRFAVANLRMGYLAARHGMKSFWQTLPVGQYELPEWLFYGGRELSQTGKFLRASLPDVIGEAIEVVHLDFHTGLGRWGECELLLSEEESAEEIEWWTNRYDGESVVASHSPTRYNVRGGFGPWLQTLLPDCHYHFATAEYGTYGPTRMLRALSDECRWTNAIPQLPPDHWSRSRLAEAFIPTSSRWRLRCLEHGNRLVARACEWARSP